MTVKPAPRITKVNAPFFAACSRHEFSLQRCTSCGMWIYYPREACPGCLSTDLEWETADGLGTIETYTLVYRPESPAFFVDTPIPIVVVKLDLGPTVIAGYAGDHPESGQRVEVDFIPRESTSIPVFRPAKEG